MFISDLFEAQAKQTLVLIPGGFHPFHPGHLSLYRSAEQAFPGATIVYVATDDRKDRPFPFVEKQKLAQIAGVNPKNFQLVKSPFVAKEVTQNFDPNNTVLIFARSEKDRDEHPKPGGVKKDGTPSYLQPYTKGNLAPMSQHGYMAYLPTVEFDAGPSGVTSATEIRSMWPTADAAHKAQIVKDLYPKNPRVAMQILDKYLGTAVAEGSEKDPVWNKGTPMPKDYTCHCGLYVHPSVRNPKAIHTPDCPYAKQQGVAEGSREQVDPNTVWEVCFDYGPHQSDKVKVRASSQEEAEQKGMRAAKKLGHRFPMLNWAMPADEGVKEGIPSFTPGSEMHKQHQARMAEYGKELNALGKKIKFHQQGQAAAQYKGAMNKMHAEKIRELLAQVDELQQRYGLNEAKTYLNIGDVVHNASQAVNAAKHLNAKVVKTAGGYYKIAPLDDPRSAVTTNVDYYETQRRLRKEIEQLNQQMGSIEGQHRSERWGVFDQLEKQFPGHMDNGTMSNDNPAAIWLSKALYALDKKYFGTPEYKQLKATVKDKKEELKNLVNSNKRSAPVAEESTAQDPNVIQMKKRARLAHPFAKSDEEALALYVNDREIRDVDNLEREQNRERKMIDRIEQGEKKLEQEIAHIDAILAQLSSKA